MGAVAGFGVEPNATLVMSQASHRCWYPRVNLLALRLLESNQWGACLTGTCGCQQSPNRISLSHTRNVTDRTKLILPSGVLRPVELARRIPSACAPTRIRTGTMQGLNLLDLPIVLQEHGFGQGSLVPVPVPRNPFRVGHSPNLTITHTAIRRDECE
jgi:hypothetical protein